MTIFKNDMGFKKNKRYKYISIKLHSVVCYILEMSTGLQTNNHNAKMTILTGLCLSERI